MSPGAPRLSLARLRALRTASQRLDRPASASIGELVRALGGVQAQVLSAAELGLRARGEGLTREAITEARERDRSIVWCWAMRGTLHLVAADDLPWMLPLFAPGAWVGAQRRLKQLGVREDHVDLAVELLERALRDEGPLPRRELAARLAKRGIETRGQAIAHLVHVAAMRGRITLGPLRGRDQTFAALADWLPRWRPREPDPAELARRFLSAYGPASPSDLAAWSGVRAAIAREAFAAIAPELAGFQGPGGEALWSLRGASCEADATVARLLPNFDGFLLGYADRSFALPPERAREVTDGGWILPQLFAGGQILGTWKAGKAGPELRPFQPLPAKVRKALEADAGEVSAFSSPSPRSSRATPSTPPRRPRPAGCRRRGSASPSR